MKRTHLYTDHEVRLFDTILGLLEEAYTSREEYVIGTPEEETESDVLVLHFVKLVNDCRAILLLAQNGFFIQAGILVRSAQDACNMLMGIAVGGDGADLVKQWLAKKRIEHGSIFKALNEALQGQLDEQGYYETRRKLNDLVHGNYETLVLYPAQSPGPTPLDDEFFRAVSFWNRFPFLYLITCLMAVRLIAPHLVEQSEVCLDQILDLREGQQASR